MMTRLPTLALIVLVFGGGAVFARQTQVGLDLAVMGLIPSGDYEDVTGPAIGGLGGLELEAFPGLALTIRGGYFGHMERRDYTRELIPIMGGVKVTSYSSSFYAAVEGGRVSIRDQYSGDDPLGEDEKRSKTAWGFGFGSAADQLDLRLSLHFWDAANMKESVTIGLSLAFLLWGY
jgi:hypothetical protein